MHGEYQCESITTEESATFYDNIFKSRETTTFDETVYSVPRIAIGKEISTRTPFTSFTSYNKNISSSETKTAADEKITIKTSVEMASTTVPTKTSSYRLHTFTTENTDITKIIQQWFTTNIVNEASEMTQTEVETDTDTYNTQFDIITTFFASQFNESEQSSTSIEYETSTEIQENIQTSLKDYFLSTKKLFTSITESKLSTFDTTSKTSTKIFYSHPTTEMYSTTQYCEPRSLFEETTEPWTDISQITDVTIIEEEWNMTNFFSETTIIPIQCFNTTCLNEGKCYVTKEGPKVNFTVLKNFGF